MRRQLPYLAAALLLAVSGCEQEETETVSQPEPQPEQTQSGAPAPAQSKTTTSQPARQETAPAQSAEQVAVRDTETITNNACLDAAKKQTNESDIVVTSNEFSEANTLVMLGVGVQRSTWRCLVSNDGQVAELSFEGDDSAGVQDSQTMTRASDQSDAADGNAVVNNACLEAVSNETGQSDVVVLSSEFSEANSLVMIGVGSDRAPWRCLVSNDGAAQEVSFAADEGKQ